MARGGIDTVTQVLATAVGLAHTTLFFMFAVRGAGMFGLRWIWAALAAIGFAVNFVGWALAKHGGRALLKKWGRWAIAISTATAGFLLFVAS